MFDNDQIAAIAGHVRSRFGGIERPVSRANVEEILAGLKGTPWLIRNAFWLSIVGIGAAAPDLLALIRLVLVARGNGRTT